MDSKYLQKDSRNLILRAASQRPRGRSPERWVVWTEGYSSPSQHGLENRQTELRIHNKGQCGRPAGCRQEQGVDDGAAMGLERGPIATEHLVLFPTSPRPGRRRYVGLLEFVRGLKGQRML